MNKRVTRLVALAVAALLFIAFLVFQGDLLSDKNEPSAEEGEKTEASAPPAVSQSIPVEAVQARPVALEDNISVSGSTVPNEEVIITSEVPGKIDQILFKEGTNVRKGATLIRLDNTELLAERERLQVQRNLNSKIAERLKALYDKEGVSLQEYEVAEAEVEKVAAEIALIDAQLEKRVIKAPFSGRLGLRMASEGSYISPGTPIVNLVSINPIKLEFNVPEKYVGTLDVGSSVSFQLSGADKNYEAKVIAREPNVDADTRTLRLKAAAPNPGGGILPGTFARVSVNLSEFSDAIMIPTQALMPELNTNKVFVVKNGKAEMRDVATGIRQEKQIQITSGLMPGDTVITTGLLQLSAGAPVQITKLKKS